MKAKLHLCQAVAALLAICLPSAALDCEKEWAVEDIAEAVRHCFAQENRTRCHKKLDLNEDGAVGYKEMLAWGKKLGVPATCQSMAPEIFMLVDKDRDGNWRKDEVLDFCEDEWKQDKFLKTCFKKKNRKACFDELDKNKDDIVSSKEMIKFAKANNISAECAELAPRKFLTVDKDRNGAWKRDEL
eukprot:gnl/TRDRNA2_/TRDRNA2_55021_c0_seq1.p1 gnl/TRDRNA2_/TRDRNA2_55021_c0~~gnl/TRDRNA2_/TRDRNA2_55021_c0_seq1.p1  ORF type:complete len:206 (-),score=54.07 gnl/TRDRNA2_/TRDRNA2_55021_c0_seq1:92-649(-)